MFLNHRAVAQYRVLAAIISGCKRPEETTICYKISLVQLITNLNVILYLSTCHTIYVVLPKISENLLVITWILASSPNFHRHLRSSHLGLVYNDPSDFATFGSTHWSLPALASLVSVAILLGPLQWRQNIVLSTGVSF